MTKTYEGFWLNTQLKIDDGQIVTPLGGKVTTLQVCVDVDYTVDGHEVRISEVRLSQATKANVAAVRRGEAWKLQDLPAAALLAAATYDLERPGSMLCKHLLGRWHNPI